jgi:hypothetical protein
MVPQRVSTSSTSVQPGPDSPNTPSRKPAPTTGRRYPGRVRDRDCLGRNGGAARLRVREPPCRPGVQRILHPSWCGGSYRARCPAGPSAQRQQRQPAAQPPQQAATHLLGGCCSPVRVRHQRCSREPGTTNCKSVSCRCTSARSAGVCSAGMSHPPLAPHRPAPAVRQAPTHGPWLPRPTRSAPPWPPSRRRPRRVASRPGMATRNVHLCGWVSGRAQAFS